MGGLLETCGNQSETIHFEINNEMNRSSMIRNEAMIHSRRNNLYPEIYSTNINTSKDNLQSARAMLKLCQEITEGTTLVSPNDEDFTSLYSTVDKRKKIKIVLDRHKEENIEIESNKENRPLKSMRNKSSRARRRSSIKEENESFDNAINFDLDGYSQSRFIPLTNSIQSDSSVQHYNTLSPSNRDYEYSARNTSDSKAGGGGLNLPLQRYQYEDVGITEKIYRKKLKEFTTRSKKSPPKVLNKKYIKSNTSNPNTHPKCMVSVSIPKSSTQIDKNILSNSSERIILSYKLLNEIDNSCILYDGEVLKIQKNKTGYKIVSRYFQITKNGFKYYNSMYSSQVYNNKPLVQFDIRHIANIEISSDNILKFKYEKIKFAFTIYLDNKKDFFEFGTDNPEYGSNIIKALTLIINYHDDMSSKSNFRYEISD